MQTRLIEVELTAVADARVIAHVRSLLVEPCVVLLNWDYGEPGQQYPCWMTLKDALSGSGIAYCEHGFGPRHPWGLVQAGHESMGMDSNWFTTFMDAFFQSAACEQLTIWRVFQVEADGTQIPLTDEDTWEATWDRVYDLRARDPARRYDCGHSIACGPCGQPN